MTTSAPLNPVFATIQFIDYSVKNWIMAASSNNSGDKNGGTIPPPPEPEDGNQPAKPGPNG